MSTTHPETRPPLSSLPRHGNRIVPWVARWSSELQGASIEDPSPVQPEGGITFGLAVLEDGREAWMMDSPGLMRDGHGYLWFPDPDDDSLRTGKPLFSQLNATRARRSVDELLCQVCGGSVVDARGRSYWLVPATYVQRGTHVTTSHPPVCPRCRPIAESMCPALQSRVWNYLAVHRVEVAGAVGDLFAEPRQVAGGYEIVQEPVARAIAIAGGDLRVLRLLTKQRVVNLHGWEKM